MKDEAFKHWLQERGLAKNSLTTRTSAVRRIERVLSDLGIEHPDLDAAFDADGLESVKSALLALKSDAFEGGQNYRVLLPDSDKPVSRLDNFIAWLGNYRQFRERPDEAASVADRIRQYALDHYIALAREQGEESVTIPVREVHDALGLDQAWANVCQALSGNRFQALANVSEPQREGPETSSTTRFVFQLIARSFTTETVQAELVRRYGEPIKSNQKMCAHETEQGRQIAIELDRPPAQLWIEAVAPVPEGLDAEVYQANRGRHSNLPERLNHDPGGELVPRPVVKVRVGSFEQLEQLLDWYGRNQFHLDRERLDVLKRAFLSRFPDFEPEAFAARSGGYFDVERAYKDDLLDQVERVCSDLADSSDEELGAHLLDILTRQGGTTLLGWRTDSRVAEVREVNPGVLDQAAGRLARAEDIPQAIEDFNETAWPLLADGQQSQPYSESRNIPTMLAALVHPENAYGINTEPISRVALELTGSRPFGFNRFTGDEYERVLEIAEAIREIMANEWGWSPRDLWDVQGFVWVVTRPDAPKPTEDAETSVQMRPSMPPTNLILHGPPGTGKTYETAWEAVRLCLGDDAAEVMRDDRDALTETYRRLVAERRIDFVTFHQSFSYEDFVEGLRPTTEPASTEDDLGDRQASAGFSLKPRDGVFKAISERARLDVGSAPTKRLDRSKSVYKVALGQRGSQEDRIREGLEKSFIHLGWGGGIDWSDARFDDFEEIRKEWNEKEDPNASGNDPNIKITYAFRSGIQVGDYVVVPDGMDKYRAFGKVTGEYHLDPEASFNPHRRSVEWIWQDENGADRAPFYSKKFSLSATYCLNPDYLDWDALETVVINRDAELPVEGARPHVLIIDEINRANISKVFGELITLLEADKRLGQLNELRVRLPYSGASLGVPTNLHIIGTMNTADRSIALLDTALRRRFEFRELMPRPDLLEEAKARCGVDLVALLRGLNERIEYLFDREHQIGHAYFMECANRADVDDVMRLKVIPLLSEYFYEDWAKVAAVLGDADGAGNFLDRVELDPPPGMDSDGGDEPRYRWGVKQPFSENCYEQFH